MEVWKHYEDAVTGERKASRVAGGFMFGPEPWVDYAAAGSTVADALERSSEYRHRVGCGLVAVYRRLSRAEQAARA